MKLNIDIIKVSNIDVYIKTSNPNGIIQRYMIQESYSHDTDELVYDDTTKLACIRHKFVETVEQLVKGKTISVYLYYGNVSYLSESYISNCNNDNVKGIYMTHANCIINNMRSITQYTYNFKYIKHEASKKDLYIIYTFKVI